MLADWLQCPVSCRIPSGEWSKALLLLGSKPPAAVSQAQWYPGLLWKGQLLRQVALVCEGASLWSGRQSPGYEAPCAAPRNKSAMRQEAMQHTIPLKIPHASLPACLLSCYFHWALKLFVLHRAGQLKGLPWNSSTKQEFHLSLRWLRGSWLLNPPVPGDIKVLLIHLKQTLSLHRWNDFGTTPTPVVWEFRN